MIEHLIDLAPELLVPLFLLAVMGLRSRINARANILIHVAPEKVWSLINPRDGKIDNWGRVQVVSKLIDPASETYQLNYTTSMAKGEAKQFQALFRVAEREPNRRLVLQRAGLEGKSERNELLQITHTMAPEEGGTRLKTSYLWGSRALVAQPLARADIWSGAYRLKGLAERGVPDDRAFFWISAAVGIVSGLISLGAFAAVFGSYVGYAIGLLLALVLVIVLFVHEFGHLLAFRLMGQPWGRIVFLPFLGAIAVPRLPYDSQGQSVFAALMGPGFSLLLAALCAIPPFLNWPLAFVFTVTGLVTVALNLFNLLPAEPLDGGIAMRSILNRVIGSYAQLGLIFMGCALMAVGYFIGQYALALFGGVAVFANLRPRKIDSGLKALSMGEIALSALSYAAIAVGHTVLLLQFLGQLHLGPA